MASRGLHLWTDVLQAAVEARCRHFHRVFVLNETDSTQDAAQRLGARPGDVVTSGRQTAGRGRLGRAWADTADQGVTVTFVLSTTMVERRCAGWNDAPRRGESGFKHEIDSAALAGTEHGTTRSVVPSGLAIASAVGVARAAEALTGRAVGIKWPNDVFVDGRKLAGILIERRGNTILLGIGLNVTQIDWPADLAGTAISLRQCGASCDRLAALETLLVAMDEVFSESDASLRDAFAQRDVLRGTFARFACDGCEITGQVVDIDPLKGLCVRTDTADGPITTLPAETTRVLDFQPGE